MPTAHLSESLNPPPRFTFPMFFSFLEGYFVRTPYFDFLAALQPKEHIIQLFMLANGLALLSYVLTSASWYHLTYLAPLCKLR